MEVNVKLNNVSKPLIHPLSLYWVFFCSCCLTTSPTNGTNNNIKNSTLMCRTLRGSTTAHGVIFTATTKKGTKFNPIRSYRYSPASFNAHEQQKKEHIFMYGKSSSSTKKHSQKLFLGNKWQIKGWGMNIKKYYIRCIFFCAVIFFFFHLYIWDYGGFSMCLCICECITLWKCIQKTSEKRWWWGWKLIYIFFYILC